MPSRYALASTPRLPGRGRPEWNIQQAGEGDRSFGRKSECSWTLPPCFTGVIALNDRLHILSCKDMLHHSLDFGHPVNGMALNLDSARGGPWSGMRYKGAGLRWSSRASSNGADHGAS